MSVTNRDDIKQLAQQIENLAHQVSMNVDSGADLLQLSEELVRNNIAFIFSVGEVFAMERFLSTNKVALGKTKSAKKVNATVVVPANTATSVTTPTNVVRNYYNVRDNRGRFARKV